MAEFRFVHPLQFVNIAVAIKLSGKCRTSIYNGMKDGTFPACIKLSERRIVWRLQDILDHNEALFNKSRTDTPAVDARRISKQKSPDIGGAKNV
jgi:predicted DNA-binding transcriptional regulator AlpA